MTNKKKQLDALWSKIVKLKAKGKCKICQRTDTLNSHHIFSRSNHSVRWDLENGVCLCACHHALCNFSAHKAPLDFAEWLKKERGEKWYNDLRVRANLIYKPDYTAIKIYLQNELEKLK